MSEQKGPGFGTIEAKIRDKILNADVIDRIVKNLMEDGVALIHLNEVTDIEVIAPMKQPLFQPDEDNEIEFN